MEGCVYLQNTLWPFIISGYKYRLSITDEGIASSLCCLDCQSWKKGSAAVCSEQALVWTEMLARGGRDTLKRPCFSNNLPIETLKSHLKLYISSGPQMKLKQFYSGAVPLTSLLWKVIVLFWSPQFCPPSQTHLPSVCTHLCLCLPFFSQVMFSRMSASNNKERDYFGRSSGRLWLEGARLSQSNLGNCTFKPMFSCREVKKSAMLYKRVWQMNKIVGKKVFKK